MNNNMADLEVTYTTPTPKLLATVKISYKATKIKGA